MIITLTCKFGHFFRGNNIGPKMEKNNYAINMEIYMRLFKFVFYRFHLFQSRFPYVQVFLA
jgi:hypothetical protein